MGYDDISVHAEEGALYKFNRNQSLKRKKNRHKNRNKYTLIVIRVDGFGMLKESKPCTHCINKIKASGIKRVTYSTNEGNIITEKIKNIITRPSKLRFKS